jgi:GTPase SAR1 family protein
MDEFLTSVKKKYSHRSSSHDQKQYPPRYSSEPVKLELVVKERNPTSNCQDLNTKQPQLVPYSDIFKNEKKQVAKKILIEGGTGIGKTTFCSSISEDWANEKLFQEFKVLLLLPLHEKKIAATSSLAELIEILQGAENLSDSIVDSMEETNGEGILVVVDGWDELDAPECSRTFLHDLLFGRILNHASIIVTSRPSHSDWLYAQGCFDRLFCMRGFNDGSIRQYIHLDFTHNHQESDRLFETVDCCPLIKSMCRIPLNCATLCHLWRTESRKRKLSTTMTELCTKMIFNVVLHSIKKVDKYGRISHLPNIESLPEELRCSWWDLCRLAFQTIQNYQINLSQFKSDMLIKFGLVEIVNEAKCDFLCPAFQEYLAAFHVANQCHSLNTHMQDELIRKQVTEFWRFLFGICGQSTNKINLVPLERAILLFSKFDHLRCLICHCAFEAKNSVIDMKAVKALGTLSDSKHFGDPKTSHDCEAILYVIKQMGNVDAELELNFKDCDFREQQLCDLAKILTNKHNKIKVRSLDLSNKYRLPIKKVADLFNKASTTFQSLQKLSLRNNMIGKKTDPGGAVYIMGALGSLKCLIQLDLSFNRLTICALEALHDNVKRHSLAQLEILLLQAAFTCDSKKNINFLKTFIPSLLCYCRKLRELDISENDLGERRSPFVSTVICALTHLTLHVNKEYESEVDKNFIRTMEDLVRREEKINHIVAHGVIVGPGRSGKNSLMDRLMGKGPPDPDSVSSSTGVLDNVIKVEVKKVCTMDATTTNLKWKRLEYDEEALELMMITVTTHIASFAEEGIKLEPVPDLITELDEPVSIESAVIFVENENEGESENETESESDIDYEKEKIPVPEVAKGAVCYAHYETKLSSQSSYSKEFSLREGPMDIFKRAVELRHRMRALREYLESSWSLYLTNTGGQLEFQELLPLLVCGPSVFFVTIPLNINLHKPYSVRYQHRDGTEEAYLSPLTLMDEILQTLATIAALDCTGTQSQEVSCKPTKPKVFFVGTHKDLLPESSADDIIQEIDRHLQNSIRHTSLYEQDSIEYAEGTDQLMFTVNNLDKDDGDFHKIRLALQRMVDRRGEFTISCPCSWLVFSLVLRAKHKSSQILSYNECFIVAQSCGIPSRIELNKALLFIHHRLGLVRYFPVEELHDFVITDPQILFDTITKLIVKTFTIDHASVREIEEFQQRGIFSIEVMKMISLKNYSDSQLPFEWSLKLLNHLGIAVIFKDQNGEQKCFFPSVLCHAPEQQGSEASTSSIRLPPPLSIAFKGGFCPRAIPGILIKSLMNDELKSSISWELHPRGVFRNQVSFGVGIADIVLKILPTHIEVGCFYPESETADQILRDHNINITCDEAYKQIKRVMDNIIVKFRECDYYFAFYCTRPECKDHPHPAKIEWDTNALKCRITGKSGHLPDGYELWTSAQIGAYQQGNCGHVFMTTIKVHSVFFFKGANTLSRKKYLETSTYNPPRLRGGAIQYGRSYRLLYCDVKQFE